jgi:hypothetical protein
VKGTVPYTRISEACPAHLSFYWPHSRKGRTLEFGSLAELAEVFERSAEGPRFAPAGSFPVTFARGAVVGRRRRRNLRTPLLVAAVFDCRRRPAGMVSERLSNCGVAHFAFGIGHLPGECWTWATVVVTDVLATSWEALEAAVHELSELAEIRPRPTSRSWRSGCFPLPAPLDDGPCGFYASPMGVWLPDAGPRPCDRICHKGQREV